ncbi:hypothetical protein [Actinophytocola sp.]|uniref:hypothetical protein n=1 Tax=Actinophytocola sp. TaxID=1872138 RepID=UPI0025C1EA0B|nr:hypothetical protein [Actinophytocola sp.]
MLLRAAEREPVVDHGAEWELVDQAAEHAEHEHGAALAAGVDGFPDGGRTVRLQVQLLLDLVVHMVRARAVRLHTHGFDAHVRPRPDVRSRSSAPTSVAE